MLISDFIINYTVPPSSAFLLVYPLRVLLDSPTLIWLYAFTNRLRYQIENLITQTVMQADFMDTMRNIVKVNIANEENAKKNVNANMKQSPPTSSVEKHRAALQHLAKHSSETSAINIRVELVLPTVIIPSSVLVSGQPDRPQGVIIRVSNLQVTNACTIARVKLDPSIDDFDMDETNSIPCSDLLTILTHDLTAMQVVDSSRSQSVHNASTSAGSSTFPHRSTDSHIHLENIPCIRRKHPTRTSQARNIFDDTWYVRLERVWIDFTGVQSARDHIVPFLNDITLNLFAALCETTPSTQHASTSVRSERATQTKDYSLVNILQAEAPIHLQLHHYQFLFLLRLAESLRTLMESLQEDRAEIRACYPSLNPVTTTTPLTPATPITPIASSTTKDASQSDAQPVFTRRLADAHLMCALKKGVAVSLLMPPLAERHTLVRSSRTSSSMHMFQMGLSHSRLSSINHALSTQATFDDDVFPNSANSLVQPSALVCLFFSSYD